MNTVFDPLNLLILAGAFLVALALRSVLGSKTGLEHSDRSFDLFSDLTPTEEKKTTDALNKQTNDEKEAVAPVWQGFVEEGSPLVEIFEKAQAIDPSFSLKEFLEGAKVAYDIILSAFAEGDVKALSGLLSEDVLAHFKNVIDERLKKHEKAQHVLVGINEACVVAAVLTGTVLEITLRFSASLVSALFSEAGEVISGDPKRVRETSDLWTFERDLRSQDPTWVLVRTQAP